MIRPACLHSHALVHHLVLEIKKARGLEDIRQFVRSRRVHRALRRPCCAATVQVSRELREACRMYIKSARRGFPIEATSRSVRVALILPTEIYGQLHWEYTSLTCQCPQPIYQALIY